MLSIYSVNSLLDTVAADSLVTLREALQAANTNAAVYDAPAGSATETDTITFAPELFLDGEDEVARTITLGGTQLTISDNLTLQGPGAELLSIDANQLSRVFYVDSGVTAGLEGLTITGGKVPDYGGGVYSLGTLTIADAMISENTAGRGGGIFARSLNLTNSTVENNSGTYAGGGISLGGTIYALTRNLSISGSFIKNNSSANGGGIFGDDGAITITDSTISYNSASSGENRGAAVYLTDGRLTVSGSHVVNNTGGGTYSGGCDFGNTTFVNSIVSNNSGCGIVDSGFAEIHALIITGSTISNNDGSGVCGGRIVVSDSMIEGNVSSTYGGGVYTGYGVTISNSQIVGNSARLGAGVYIYANDTTSSLTGCTITNNVAATYGGGVYTTGVITIADSTVEGNMAGERGGGVYNYRERGAGTTYTKAILTIEHSSISNNTAPSAGGVYDYGTLNVVDSTISGNSAEYYGGAIWSGSGTNVTSVITLVNSTVAGNVAGQHGGGLAISGTTMTVTNSTITDNAAYDIQLSGSGGGLYSSSGTVTLTNSIVAGNEAAVGHSDVQLASDLSAGSDYNLIGVWEESVAPGTNSVWGTAEEPLDPMLVAIMDEDGTICYHRPMPGSPAIDAGSDALAVDSTGAALVEDIRGGARIQGDAVDIGAVEYSETVEIVVSPTPAVELLEGESSVVSVCLSAAPAEPVTVTISKRSGDSEAIASDQAVLVFDATNWNVVQEVTLSALQDEDRGREQAIFSFSSAGMETVRVSVSVADDDPQTYVVTSLTDVVAADGVLTLREALQAANTNADVCDAPAGCDGSTDAITFAPGLFTGGAGQVARSITLGGTQLEILDDLSLQGPGGELLTIDADGLSRVFYVGEGVTASIDGLAITGGMVESGDEATTHTGHGGGIYAVRAELSLSNTTIVDNSADYGGGVCTQYSQLDVASCLLSGNSAYMSGGGICSSGTTTIINSTISNNVAQGWSTCDGGGICSNGTATIINSTISGNSALKSSSTGDGYGGGIYWNGTATFTNVTFSDNLAATNGGAIYIFSGQTSSASVTLTDSTLLNNSAGVSGGAISVFNNGTCHTSIALTNSTLLNNSASTSGGAIYSIGTSTSITVASSLFSHNSAASGGAIYNSSASDVLNVTSSTFSDNSATGSGGAIYSTGTLVVTNATLVDNSAKAGGGVYVGGGTATVANSIIAMNTATTSPNFYGTLAPGSGYNLIGSWSSILWGMTTILMEDGTTTYYRPAPGSQAYNAGSNALAVDAEGNPLETDMLGDPRITGSAVDIGAVEWSDSPQIVIDPGPYLDVLEGGTTAIAVSLSAAPATAVTVTVGKLASGSDNLSVNPTTLVFDETNWDQPQVVTVSAAEDDDRDNDDEAVFTFAAEGMHTIAARVSVIDNDPQVYVVDSIEDVVADDGLLTLREALEAANTNTAVYDAPKGGEGVADVITFDPDLFTDGEDAVAQTIFLGGTVLTISADVRIEGPGAGLLSIDAGGKSRVFYVNSGVTAALEGLTITGGVASGTTNYGGGIYNLGRLTITGAILTRNRSTGTTAGYGGAIGTTGNSAELTIVNSTLAGNWSTTSGGGIYVDSGTLTLANSIVATNSTDVTFKTGSLSPESSHNLIGDDPAFAEDYTTGKDGVWGTSDDVLGDVHLRADSLAIDAGDNALAVDSQGNPLATDADGLPRLGGGTVDIGAYEYNSEHIHAATDDYAELPADQTHVLDLLANDMYPSGATVTIEITDQPDWGTVVVNSDGTVSYTADYTFRCEDG